MSAFALSKDFEAAVLPIMLGNMQRAPT